MMPPGLTEGSARWRQWQQAHAEACAWAAANAREELWRRLDAYGRDLPPDVAAGILDLLSDALMEREDEARAARRLADAAS